MKNISEFNCQWPGVSGPEPIQCEHCGSGLVHDRETVNHCDRLCFEAWLAEEE
jgi:hypothetical protein